MRRRGGSATDRQGARGAASGVRYGWGWVAVLLAALAPLAALSLFASPQTDDFCYGAIVRHDGLAGIWRHYENWSGRLVASALIPLPTIVSDLLGADLFDVYGCFAASFLLGFAILCYWAIGALLPERTNPSRLFLALALFIAMVANAPTTRHLVFWMPGAFTYAFPSLVMLWLFGLLYRALEQRTWISRGQFSALVPLLLLTSLCTELSGPIAIWMLVSSLYGRRRSGFEHTAAVHHVVLIAAALIGTAIVYLAPGNLVRASTHGGGSDLPSALFWGTMYVPAFLVLYLTRPGVVGWLLLLALAGVDHDAVPPDRHSARALIGIAVSTLLGGCWVSCVAGYYAQGGRLPARALNLLFLLSVLCLSFALKAYCARSMTRLSNAAPGFLTLTRLRVSGVALLLLSPAVLGAVWQLPQAPQFRREARAQLLAISATSMPIASVQQLETTPQLLFNNRLSPDGTEWPNRCLARYLGKQAVVPIP